MNPPRKMNGCWALALAGMELAMACGVCRGAVYVDVETEVGTFTIEMDAGARNGGAAFLGLAEGWVDWVDPRSGQPRHGERYHEGTLMSWVYKDEAGEAVLMGNLGHIFTMEGGKLNRNNGGSIQLKDDVAGATGLTARSVAMIQQEGPHTLNGRWAVMLKDADAYYGGRWSRIGTVVSNWGVVETLAGLPTDGGGWLVTPVAVRSTRIHGDEEKLAAWRRVAESNAPTCGRGETGLSVSGESGTVFCRMTGKGRFAVIHTTNLSEGVWNVNWINWNEGGSVMEQSVPFSTATNEMGLRRNFAVTTEEYPELGGPTITGKYSFLVEWEMGGGEENQVYQYDLDVGADTGMVRQLDWETKSKVKRSAGCNQILVERGGANSTMVSFVINDWRRVPYYWLGESEKGFGTGRFRMWEWGTGEEEWGTWKEQPWP